MFALPYQDPPEMPDAEFDMYCTGRVLEHWHTGSMTRRVPELHRSVPEAQIFMHPEDAQEARPAARNGGQGGVAARRDRRPPGDRGRNKPPVGLIFVPFFDEPAGEQAHARRHLPDLEGDRLQEMRGEGQGL